MYKEYLSSLYRHINIPLADALDEGAGGVSGRGSGVEVRSEPDVQRLTLEGVPFVRHLCIPAMLPDSVSICLLYQ